MRLAPLLVVIASLAASCGDSPPPEKPTPPMAKDRRLTPRDKLPDVVKPLLPRRGYYAAGGGMVSSAWRVVVDRDARTIFAGTSTGANASSFGKMDTEATRPLSDRNDAHLTELAEAAWRAPHVVNPHPTADYDEILIFVDGSDAFYLEGFGPIQEPTAAKAIEELRAAAGL